jgi:hypothetical protein
MSARPEPYGVAAEFETPDDLVNAARAARERGYRRLEAYTPYPIRELDDVLPMTNYLPAVVLAAGAVGGFGAFYLQFGIAALVYPLNIGGRPLNSWPQWIPIIFELTVLFAACAAFFGMLFFAGFPAVYHPLFRIPSFRRVSDNGFFLCIEARDPRFDAVETPRFLRSLAATSVWEVDDE